MKRLFHILTTVLALLPLAVHADEPSSVFDSVEVHFKQSRIELLPDFSRNREAIDRITDSLSYRYADSLRWQLNRVHVVGAASPEGSVRFNRWLSERRADAIYNYMNKTFGFTPPKSLRTHEFRGRDWRGLVALVERDSLVPYRDEVLALVGEIVAADGGKVRGIDPLTALKRLRGGEPYRYMYAKLFPELRASKVLLWYDRVPNLEYAPWRNLAAEGCFIDTIPAPVVPEIKIDFLFPPLERPFYMSLRTNMLYDAGLIPNIGADFYLGKNWSVSALWMYSWWKADGPHWYWRTYGGDLAIRRWIGKAANNKPLTGHHIGLYAQVLTYDFEVGGRGYIGGRPGGSLWDKCNYGGGLEYGYSLPIGKRLNVDFTVAVGYLGGECQEYIPDKGCYVWDKTVKRHWVGPTKAEISLVWLLGRGNTNRKKGGEL